MSETKKTFQILDTDSKVSLIILNGDLSYVLKKIHVYVYKVSYCDKGKMNEGQ